MNKNNNLISTNRKFFDLWANTYDWFLIKPWMYYIQKKIVENLNLRDNQKILDIGCGTGDILVLISKLSRAKLYGLDISENMLKRASRKLGKKAALKLGEVSKLPFSNNMFDYVLSTEAFHHFPDPNKALKEINKILKKNRHVLIADVNFYLSFIHKLFKWLEPGHVKIYSLDEFRNMFNDNGFKVLKQKRMGLFAILTIGKKK
ncbi:methyltransferase domain-containing protein [Candidatus Woesearchaeota archaeon]|nr:methyltransferase domain-containing protein [Candidatus Woesearchaeota archaeon]